MTEKTDDPFYRKTDALGRQTWDKDFFATKALARQCEGGVDPGVNFQTGNFGSKKNVPAPVEWKPLQQRKEQVHLDSELGKARVVTAHTPKQHQGGFWCDVCECLMKDSQTYLDHINGKKHNRQLGMSMRVEKMDANAIKEKLQRVRLERAKEQERSAGFSIELRLAEASEKEKQKKKEKKEKKKKKKRLREEEEEQIFNPFDDPAAAAALMPDAENSAHKQQPQFPYTKEEEIEVDPLAPAKQKRRRVHDNS